jgi:hypothetical protein
MTPTTALQEFKQAMSGLVQSSTTPYVLEKPAPIKYTPTYAVPLLIGAPKGKYAHKLKTLTRHFEDIRKGAKKAEARFNDRGFQIGDSLVLQEWDERRKEYTGREMEMEVTHILEGAQFGIEDGFCVMSITPKE